MSILANFCLIVLLSGVVLGDGFQETEGKWFFLFHSLAAILTWPGYKVTECKLFSRDQTKSPFHKTGKIWVVVQCQLLIKIGRLTYSWYAKVNFLVQRYFKNAIDRSLYILERIWMKYKGTFRGAQDSLPKTCLVRSRLLVLFSSRYFCLQL